MDVFEEESTFLTVPAVSKPVVEAVKKMDAAVKSTVKDDRSAANPEERKRVIDAIQKRMEANLGEIVGRTYNTSTKVTAVEGSDDPYSVHIDIETNDPRVIAALMR